MGQSYSDHDDEDHQAQQQQQQQDRSLARRAARGTLATFALRLVSFGCTQYTLRVLDPSTLGRALVQLDLLLTTILFVSREGFRLALTRNVTDDATWNVAWWSIPMVTLVGVLAVVGWHWHALATNMDADFYWAGLLYCTAACVEGWAEPAVLWSLRQLQVTTKASAEGLATVGKTISTVLILQHWKSDWPVTAFGVAQLAYAVLYAAVLYRHTWRYLVAPQWSLESLDRTTTRLVAVFTLQGVFKHLLTEGDRIVLATLSGTYDQGVYAMGSAYGGMAARLILQPLEENTRLLWSRLSVPHPTATQLEHLQDSYTLLVKLVLYIGCIFSCLAVNYTSVVLKLLAGNKWGSNQEATHVLTAFCVYTAFLACNGMTEAFVYAVASSGTDLGRLGAVHTAVGLVFAGVASVAVARYGAVGLVAANCVAMLCRSIYSILYAARYFSQRDPTKFYKTLRVLLQQMSPNRWVILTFLAVYGTTRWSNLKMQHQAAELGGTVWLTLASNHVAVGVAAAAGLVATAYTTERTFVQSFRSMWVQRKAKAE